MHTQAPILIGGVGVGAPHPFRELPVELLAQLYYLSGEESKAGLGGVLHYFNHFLRWEGPLAEGAAGGWTLSGVTGAATITQPNVRHGEIALTADATANCNPTLALGGAAAPANFIYSVGKRMWCFARLKMATVASTEFFFGFGTPDTQPTTTNTFPADGIFLSKVTSAADLTLQARKDGTSTSKSAILPTNLADATYTTVGFLVDALGNIIPYQDGNAITSSVIAAGDANLPGSGDPMQFMVGFLGASQVVTLDWLLVAQEI